MDIEKIEQLNQQIDSLTDDDDIKQSIWLLIMETHNIDIQFHLDRVMLENEIADELFAKCNDLILNTLDHAYEILTLFHPSEQHVLVMLSMDIDRKKITQYKNMQMCQLLQMLDTISKHPCWSEYKNDNKKTP